jgi:hypothetical protein
MFFSFFFWPAWFAVMHKLKKSAYGKAGNGRTGVKPSSKRSAGTATVVSFDE